MLKGVWCAEGSASLFPDNRKLQQIAAAAPPLRQRNVSMLAADWALPGGKSYPKRPIGYRTRSELRLALQARDLCREHAPHGRPARPNTGLFGPGSPQLGTA